MTAPAADDAYAFRQPGGENIAARAVRILDDDLLRAGRDRAVAGRERLPRHLLAEFGVVGMGLPRFVPMGDAGSTFDIDADIDLHVPRPSAELSRLLPNRGAGKNLAVCR